MCVLKWTCLSPAQYLITHPPFPGAHGRHLPSTFWLQTSSATAHSTHEFFSEPFILLPPRPGEPHGGWRTLSFEISDTQFLANMPATYPQPQIPLKLWQLPLQLISCLISTLHMKLCEGLLLNMCNRRCCTNSGSISSPPCWSSLLSKTHPSLDFRSYRYTDTGSNMPTTPRKACTDLVKSHFSHAGGLIQRPTSCMTPLNLEILQTPNPTPDWTEASTVILNIRHWWPFSSGHIIT